jgi:hypothetical protein
MIRTASMASIKSILAEQVGENGSVDLFIIDDNRSNEAAALKASQTIEELMSFTALESELRLSAIRMPDELRLHSFLDQLRLYGRFLHGQAIRYEREFKPPQLNKPRWRDQICDPIRKLSRVLQQNPQPGLNQAGPTYHEVRKRYGILVDSDQQLYPPLESQLWDRWPTLFDFFREVLEEDYSEQALQFEQEHPELAETGWRGTICRYIQDLEENLEDHELIEEV